MKGPAQPVRWVRLGDYIEPCDERNADGRFGIESVHGINKNKDFMPTAANVESVDLRKYIVVRKDTFAFSGMQTGRDVCIRIALHESPEAFVISPAYQTFRVKPSAPLLPQFLLMLFKRLEMDRYGWFLSDSSVRSNLDWSRFVDIRIPLPDIGEQRRIVAVWRGLRNIQEQNEALAEPLLALCQSRMEELKKRATAGDDSVDWVALGEYIEPCDERNDASTFGVNHLKGVTSAGVFDESKATTDGLDFTKYKIVREQWFAYNPSRINLGSIALCDASPCIVSPMYLVFRIKPQCQNMFLSEYLATWFKRKEFLRSTLFYAFGSVRDTFGMNEMKRVRIPLPRIDEQKRIVAIYEAAREAKRIAEEAGKLSESICPALMRRAAEAAT